MVFTSSLLNETLYIVIQHCDRDSGVASWCSSLLVQVGVEEFPSCRVNVTSSTAQYYYYDHYF